MYLLSGGGTELPEIGGSIEWQLGEDKWRKTAFNVATRFFAVSSSVTIKKRSVGKGS